MMLCQASVTNRLSVPAASPVSRCCRWPPQWASGQAVTLSRWITPAASHPLHLLLSCISELLLFFLLRTSMWKIYFVAFSFLKSVIKFVEMSLMFVGTVAKKCLFCNVRPQWEINLIMGNCRKSSRLRAIPIKLVSGFTRKQRSLRKRTHTCIHQILVWRHML